MINEIQIQDSLKVLQDSVKSAITEENVFNQITFDPSKIFSGNSLLITVVGYVVVFAALLLLFIIIANLKNFLMFKQRKKLKRVGHRAAEEKDLSIPGDINAAIAIALHLHFEELHDIESTTLTIKKVQRPYSPWSSKLYGLREIPLKK
ncbi:MAG: OadG family protein [Ignavibacteria bacterium]|jgi:hypothetical protein